MEDSRDARSREDSTAAFLRSSGPFSARENNAQSTPFDGIHNQILSDVRGAAVDPLELESADKSAKTPFFGNGKGKSYGRRLSPRSLSLIVFGVLILLLAIGGLIYVALNGVFCKIPILTVGSNGFSTYDGDLKEDIPCTSAYCAEVAGRLLNRMSPEGNACDKWYPYTCAGFIAHNDIPGGSGSFSMFSVAGQQVDRDIVDTYKNTSTVNSFDDFEDALYHACLDVEGRKSSGEVELITYANSISNLLSLSSDEIKKLNSTDYNRGAFLGNLTNMGISLFVNMYFTFDFTKVNPPYELGFFGSPDDIVGKDKILRAFDDVFNVSNSDIDKRLTNLAAAYDKLIEPFVRNKSRKVKFDDIRGFKDGFKATSIPLLASAISRDTVVTVNTAYIDALFDLDFSILIDAARIAVMEAFAGTLSDDLQLRITGRSRFTGDRKSCTKNIQYITEVRYLKHVMDDERVKMVRELVDDIKGEFRKKIEKYSWMDNTTRTNALAKLDALKPRIAHPEWMKLNSSEVLDKELAKRIGAFELYKNASFASRLGLLGRSALAYNLLKIGHEKRDFDEWGFPVYEINAYYDPTRNEIVVPYAIMTYPFVEPITGAAAEVEKAISLTFMISGIGSVLGHEITHGFDNSGANWDANGTLNPWMTAHSKASFDKAVDCIEKQYSTYNVTIRELNHGYYEDDVIPLNGTLEAGENIADNGGVSLAYAVLNKRFNESMLDFKAISGFSLSLRQLFFVGYAQNWCALYDPSVLSCLLGADPHAPGKWRAEGPLRNLVNFTSSYECKKNSVMAPEERCVVW